MDITIAKELVVEAGKKLVETGLIARTWGNVSARVSDSQFVITPSGRPYETLTPEDIVLVKIDDLSYEGDIKPSSEKGIHASCYRLRKDVNFVIHTHQVYASVVSAIGADINYVPDFAAGIIGKDVPCAAYGLPGTSTLRKGVAAALTRSDSKAVVMCRHGALCMGGDSGEAFLVAQTLERVCEQHLAERCSQFTGAVSDGFSSVRDYVLCRIKENATETAAVCEAAESARVGGCFSIGANDRDTAVIDIKSGTLIGGRDVPDTADLHWMVYKKREDVNNILHTKKDDILAVSAGNKKLLPLLDDFAQLVGPSLKCAVFDPNRTLKSSKKAVKSMKGRNAVLLKDNGALCCAGNKSDAEAVEMVTDKNCKAYLGSRLYDKVKPINALETRLMRFVYKQKYSKQAK